MTDTWWENIEPHVIAMETHCKSANDPTWTTSLMATKAGITWGIINATKEWLVLPWADLRSLEIGESVPEKMTAAETATWAGAGGLIGVAVGRRRKKKQFVTPIVVITSEGRFTFEVFGTTRDAVIASLAPVTGGLNNKPGSWADAPPPATAPITNLAEVSLAGQLSQLAGLHESGVLTEAEFAAAKARLLG